MHLIISVSTTDIDSVVSSLERIGVSVVDILRHTGIVLGEYGGRFEDLRSIPGVEAVERSGTMRTCEDT